MGDKTDQAKGKLKEQVGRATDDEQLQREGRLENAKGKAKEGVEKVKQGAREALR